MIYKGREIKVYRRTNTPSRTSLSIQKDGFLLIEDGYLYEIRALQRAKQIVDEGWPETRAVSPRPPWNEKPLPEG